MQRWNRCSAVFKWKTYLQMNRIFPEKFVGQKVNETLICQSVNFNQNYWGSAANFLEMRKISVIACVMAAA
ncbi:hypothetical protein A3781_04870 [Bacillus badius]|nr:hypothetical protein A3781_04870 [Bacillus badius]